MPAAPPVMSWNEFQRLRNPRHTVWRARMLLDRDGPGDRAAAAALAAEVAGRYRDLGLPRLADRAAALGSASG